MSSSVWSNYNKGSPRKINKDSSFNKAEKTPKRRTKLIKAKHNSSEWQKKRTEEEKAAYCIFSGLSF